MINELFYKHLTIRNIVFLVVLFLVITFALQNVDITVMFFASIVIACSLNPLVDKLTPKIGRTPAAALVLGGFVLLLTFILGFILYLCFSQIASFSASFTKYLNSIDELVETNKTLQMIGITQETIETQLQHISDNAGTIFNGTLAFIQSLSSALIYLLISLLCTFFFMADKDKIKETTLKLFPSKTRKRASEIIDIIGKKMGGYIVAQAYAVGSVAVIMTIGLLLFGVEYAYLLGLITAILDLVPIIGPAIALIICLIANIQAGIVPLIGVVISFVASQFIEDNLVKPYFFSKLLNIHPILIFLFLFIGAKYFGIVGALFAPAIAAAVCVLVEELYMKNIN